MAALGQNSGNDKQLGRAGGSVEGSGDAQPGGGRQCSAGLLQSAGPLPGAASHVPAMPEKTQAPSGDASRFARLSALSNLPKRYSFSPQLVPASSQ